MRALITTIVGTLLPATVMAAGTARGMAEDTSGIFVWVFLGFCAMIVVAQVIPAVLLATGMVKGIVSVVKHETSAVTAHNS